MLTVDAGLHQEAQKGFVLGSGYAIRVYKGKSETMFLIHVLPLLPMLQFPSEAISI